LGSRPARPGASRTGRYCRGMETPEEFFQRVISPRLPQPNTPQRRRCSGIKGNGERCNAWAVTGKDQCAGHLKLVPLDSAVGVAGRRKAAEKRRHARLSVRERAAAALDDDWPKVLKALRRGLADRDAGRAARTAVAYVQLVYGRQLQQPEDEQPADPLDVSSMTREQRNAMKRRILARRPDLVSELLGDDRAGEEA
jgi:hypothetical protein